MPEVSRFFGLLIKIQYRDHAPPHFHIWRSGRSQARMNILTVNLLKGGKLPKPQLALVAAWTYLHQQELLAAWERAFAGVSPGKIPPLT